MFRNFPAGIMYISIDAGRDIRLPHLQLCDFVKVPQNVDMIQEMVGALKPQIEKKILI